MFGKTWVTMRLKRVLGMSLRAIALGAVIVVSSASHASPAIYVFREKDGSIRFTNRKPPTGVTAKLFTSSKSNFSVYRVGPTGRGGSKFVFRRAQQYGPFIDKIARQFSVDANLVKAVVHAESGFNPHAVSSKGAQGLMQLMPGTARLVGVRNPFAAEENLRGGVRHLARLSKKYDDIRHAIAAYNAGEGAVDQYRGIPPFSETQTYVSRVLALRDHYRRGENQGHPIG